MKKIFEIIDLIVGTINQTMAVVGLSLGVLLAFINVILRYAFDMSLTWAAELTNYLFIWSVDLNIPLWIPHLVLPISFALAAYRCAEKLVEIYQTDSKDIKLYNEHEAVINEIKSQGEK